jgi:hypothetical protein
MNTSGIAADLSILNSSHNQGYSIVSSNSGKKKS